MIVVIVAIVIKVVIVVRVCSGRPLEFPDSYFDTEYARNIICMMNLLGWLETRLAQITSNYLKSRKLFLSR